MLECANGDPEILKTVITGDETWVYGYDLETKVQSSQWKHSSSPRPKKAQWVQSKVKVPLTDFFDYCGIVHQLCTRRSNYQQRILSGSHPPSSQCSSAQETGPVGLTQLAIAS
jgi:hypothetical protein